MKCEIWLIGKMEFSTENWRPTWMKAQKCICEFSSMKNSKLIEILGQRNSYIVVCTNKYSIYYLLKKYVFFFYYLNNLKLIKEKKFIVTNNNVGCLAWSWGKWLQCFTLFIERKKKKSEKEPIKIHKNSMRFGMIVVCKH